MIYLGTGTPGAGKTINSIKHVQEVLNKVEIPSLLDRILGRKPKQGAQQKRQVYYYNIKKLNPQLGWIELSEEDVKKWYELPKGSIIFIDEAYDIFPVRHGSKQVPEHVRRLATHRHDGFDIVLIMQKVNGQIDPFIRGLVGQHHHYERVFGTHTVCRFIWPRCSENPDSKAARKDAICEYVRIDKKYYNAYKSAEEHTHRTLIPKFRFILFGLAILFTLVMGYRAYGRFFGDSEPQIPQGNPIEFSEQSDGYIPKSRNKDSDNLTYQELITPAIEGIPWSAPIYSEVIEPQSWPRPAACVTWHDRNLSVCYTQQGTRLYIPEEMAATIVKDGFFDPTKPDTGSGRVFRESRREYTEHTPRPSNQVVYLDDTRTRMKVSRGRPVATF